MRALKTKRTQRRSSPWTLRLSLAEGRERLCTGTGIMNDGPKENPAKEPGRLPEDPFPAPHDAIGTSQATQIVPGTAFFLFFSDANSEVQLVIQIL